MIWWSQAFKVLWMNTFLCKLFRNPKKTANSLSQARTLLVTTIIRDCFNTKDRKLQYQNKRTSLTARHILIFNIIFFLREDSLIMGQGSSWASVDTGVWSCWAAGIARDIYCQGLSSSHARVWRTKIQLLSWRGQWEFWWAWGEVLSLGGGKLKGKGRQIQGQLKGRDWGWEKCCQGKLIYVRDRRERKGQNIPGMVSMCLEGLRVFCGQEWGMSGSDWWILVDRFDPFTDALV